MGLRRLTLCVVTALALPGCGSADEDGGGGDRASALSCLKARGIPARPVGADSVQVGDPASGPRIRFFLTNGQAEAFQFQGEAEGAEQIGEVLLFTRGGSDRMLERVEGCLND